MLICLIFCGAVCRWTVFSEAASYSEDARLPEEAGLLDNACISYLGPEGTYTEEAARFFFQDTAVYLPEGTVDEAIADVLAGKADYAVIPQENTLGGAVTNYVDALIGQDGIYVVGEVILPISQTLMAIPGTTLSDIKTVCSHAQGIKQSEAWRAEHLPGAVTKEMDSTAAAASYVAQQQDKSIAAVAAPAAAELYGLTVLAENIQITDANKTRFYVLSTEPLSGADLTQAVFVADCRASLLDDILVEIHEAGLKLVTIHDRPEGSALGSYYYIIEVEENSGISADQVSRVCSFDEIRYFGCFDAVEKAA